MEKNSRGFLHTWWGMLITAILSTFLIVLLAIAVYLQIIAKIEEKESNNPSADIIDDALWEKIQGTEANYWLGAEEPRLVIVEFSDFTCPYCRNSYTTIREIGERYGDQIKIIYRDYPVLSDTSVNLALAARCAGEQKKFWSMHDKLFQNQGKGTKEEVVSLANQIGLNTERFIDCIDSQKYYPDIARDLADAKAIKINGTPTWFIGGQRLEGEIPRDLFIFIIDQLLNNYPIVE